MTKARTVSVLLVEDNEVDAEVIRRAFRKAKLANPLIVARDGVEALERLRAPPHSEAAVPRPFLMLLDLRLPRMSGLELLEELRADPHLTNTIVFVLTTSADEADKRQSYAHHVAGYILKSQAGEGLLQMAALVDCYWRIVEFPPQRQESEVS